MPREQIDRGRPLREIVRRPKFVVAVFVGVASYTLMNLVMTSAPLAMVGCGHSVTDATLGIQWHVLGMYAPSFFTGSLIVRYGVNRIVALGLACCLCSALVGIAGFTVAHFWISLTLLGHRLELRLHRRDHDRGAEPSAGGADQGPVVQRFPDFRFDGDRFVRLRHDPGDLGWVVVNGVMFPPIIAAAALLLWLMMRERHQPA